MLNDEAEERLLSPKRSGASLLKAASEAAMASASLAASMVAESFALTLLLPSSASKARLEPGTLNMQH